MADKRFGVKDINLIGASGTPTIDSPNNLNINAVNVAISTDITVAGKVSLGAGTSISSPAANTLTLGTNSVERVRLTSDGRIGIATDDPNSLGRVSIVVPPTGGHGAINIQNHEKGSGKTNIVMRSLDNNGGNWADAEFRAEAYSFKIRTTERLRITSAGLVGINTTTGFDTSVGLAVRNGVSGSDHTMIDIIANTNETSRVVFSDDSDHNQGRIQYNHSGNSLGFYTNGNNERLHIASNGSVGIGLDNPEDYHASANSLVTSSGITLANTSQGSIFFADSSTGTGEYVGQINYYHSNNQLSFVTNNTERMRLSGNGEHMVYSDGTVSALRTAAASSGSAEILYCTRNSSSVTVGTGVYAIYSNGSASGLSDRTQKKNIETTRDGYLEDLNRLRVVKYNWNDQEDGTPKELGLIAQEVEEVFPGLISNMRSDVGIGTTASTKGIKTSVLPYMLLKALQEANAEIVALKARVNTLEGS